MFIFRSSLHAQELTSAQPCLGDRAGLGCLAVASCSRLLYVVGGCVYEHRVGPLVPARMFEFHPRSSAEIIYLVGKIVLSCPKQKQYLSRVRSCFDEQGLVSTHHIVLVVTLDCLAPCWSGVPEQCERPCWFCSSIRTQDTGRYSNF